MTLPYAMLPVIRQQFFDDDGVPLSDGSLAFFETATTTPLTVYSDQDGSVLGTTVDLDAAGRAPQIYIGTTAYTLKVYNSADVLQYTIQYVSDVGSAFLSQMAVIQTTGTTTSTSPYTVQATDNMVVVQGVTDPFVVQLPPAAEHLNPLVIKNDSDGEVDITMAGTETCDFDTGPYVLPAKTGSLLPTVTICSDGVSAWFVTGGIGLG